MAAPGQPSFIVDFGGLPGAGKSTLSHAVANALRASGEIVTEPTRDITCGPSRRLRKVSFAARTLLRHPRASMGALGQIVVSRQRTLRDFWLGAFNFLYICGVLAKATSEPGIHLLDQGYFNALSTISFSASASTPLTPLARLGFRCCDHDRLDLVLVIEARPETVLARLRARPGTASRLEGRGGTSVFGAGLDAAVNALDQVRVSLEALARNGQGRVRLKAVDNDAPLGEDQVEAVAALVRRAWKSDTNGRSPTARRSHRPQVAVRP